MDPKIEDHEGYLFYVFSVHDKLTIIYYYTPDDSDIEISAFVNKSGEKGAGKRLFCDSLRWIQANLPTVSTVSLAASPHANVYKSKGMTKNNAQKKLDSYYISLGFAYTNEKTHDFQANLETLLKQNCQTSGGKTRRRRKTRKLRRS
jgi:hypothetical protein